MKHAKTEQRNQQSRGLDGKSTLEILRILNREDATVASAVRSELPKIARAVTVIEKAFRAGGRLFYVGAGTSGRLGILDAAECPPTFGTSPRMVDGILAGGTRAFAHAVDGAEDSTQLGASDLRGAKVSKRDVVVGITASGNTPYVLGALKLARQRGAVTVGVTSNANSSLAHKAQIVIAPDTGPEAIAGSTRLKAGTAQKMVLNLLSTASMVRIGRVYENWMVHVALTNRKLQRRAAHILEEATGMKPSAAEHALSHAGHDLPVAIVAAKTGVTVLAAKRILAKSNGNVRQAIASAKKPGARTAGQG